MAMSAFALDAVSGAPEYTGKMLRGALSALLGPPPSGRPLGATSGVRPGTPTSTVSVAGSTVTIAPHSGILDVQADATTGPYLYAVTAAETVTLNAAHATYARWDRISVQLSDPAAGDGTSTPGVAIVYTPGTPAASPALPAEPARSLTLARVVVPQSGGGAATVVWLAPEARHTDTGWITSGLTITAATNFAITNYRLRKIGNRVVGRISLSYSGSQSSGSNGRLGSAVPVCTMPSDWGSVWGVEMLRMACWDMAASGPASWWARPSGQQIQLLGSTLPSWPIPATIGIGIDYLTD